MTTTKQKSVGAKQGRGARQSVARPLWQRVRFMLLTIANDGLSPHRAALIANVPSSTLEDPRLQHLVSKAQALVIRDWLSSVTNADNSGQEHVDYANPTAEGSPDAPSSGRTRAEARTRVLQQSRSWKRTDWKARAWALERTFPSEYGSQQPAQVAETVVSVLGALAALRQQPASLGSLRHVPQLPASQSPEDARAREGTGQPPSTT